MQAVVNFVGEGEDFAVAIEFNGLLGAVIHRIAMVAISQMGLESVLQSLVQLAVQIPANFFDGLIAVHLVSSLESFA
jgi:hypothetical protein